ncbi:hypothetical protein J2X20_003595 [Pelomonas saccharophila]|uniref:Type III secretion protein n=1 Tax=Roseateles saccharophilus TaxID=304 RepID=A0ABU1YPZ8_ROSSA|nr:hypothetical protein [Roseateles saccharophilus]MDR7270937.1 hypothetical protein [Roseateles saccharophilus]
MSNTLLNTLAAAPVNGSTGGKTNGGGSWFEAMADAWGKALDKQAGDIETASNAMNNGGDTPSAVTELTAMSLKMSFLASSSHTAVSTVGSALETMARKQ